MSFIIFKKITQKRPVMPPGRARKARRVFGVNLWLKEEELLQGQYQHRLRNCVPYVACETPCSNLFSEKNKNKNKNKKEEEGEEEGGKEQHQ